MAGKTSKKRGNLILAIIAFIFCTLPGSVSAIWSLFYSTPFFEWIKNKGIMMPPFSLSWITWPIGIFVLICIYLQNHRHHKKSIEKPKRKTKEEKLDETLDRIARKNFPERFLPIVTVHSAIWMATDGKTFDVTEMVKAYVSDGKLEIKCTPDIFGDPSPGLGKVMTIDYFFDGKNSKKMFPEGRIVRLP